MEDMRLSASWVGAAACWILGVGLVAMAGLGKAPVGQIGLVFVAGGVTFSVKGFLHKLWRCEVSAFRLGQLAERDSREQKTGLSSVN